MKESAAASLYVLRQMNGDANHMPRLYRQQGKG